MKIKEVNVKRKINYFWEGILMQVCKPIVYILLKTKITPNMITLFNLVCIIPSIIYVAWKRNFIAVAILIQVYAIIDILDGTIARNKNMTSDLGRKLDCFCDDFFYILAYGVICYMNGFGMFFSLVFVGTVKIYGLIATNFVVKKMKNTDNFKHTKIKQFFRKHSLILGMDVSMQNLIASISLILEKTYISFCVIIGMWIFDIVYRLYEVTIYQKKH